MRNTRTSKNSRFPALSPSAGSTLTGDGNANWFVGGNGRDTLTGGGGNDTLDGERAFNTDLTPGDDTVVYSGNRADYSIAIQGATLTIRDLRNGSPDGTDTVTNIEILHFANKDITAVSFNANIGTAQFGTDDALDILSGDGKDDSFYGLAGDDEFHGGGGSNLMVGGKGNDSYYIAGDVNDTIIEKAAEGTDTIVLDDFSGRPTSVSLTDFANVENVVAAVNWAVTLTVNGLNNSLTGGNLADTLFGGSGDDTLIGGARADVLFGGNGDDVLIGGSGIGIPARDMMTGGAGKDVFVFASTVDSDPNSVAADVITDFNTNAQDRIDLSGIDAIPGGSDDSFVLIGGHAFTAFGQVRVMSDGTNTFVEVNSTGDRHADLRIRLNGVIVLGQLDFIL